MSMRRRALLRTALALPLAGCLPVPYGSYYLPTAVDAPARRVRGWCQGQAGPETRLELDQPLPLSAQVQLVPGRPAGPLRLAVRLPPGRSLQFDADELQMVLGDGRRLSSRPTMAVWRTLALPPGVEADAARLAPLAGPAATRATMSALGPEGYAPRTLRLRGPTLGIDGRRLAIPAETLTRPEGDSLLRYRSAARLRELEARTADCRRDTPQRACDNLLRYDDLSFQGSEDELVWRAMVASVDISRRGRQLRVDLGLESPRALRWRLVEPQLVVDDEAGAGRRTLELRSLDLRYTQNGPLAAAIRATPSELPAETHVEIDLALPEGLERFDVRLPAARIDGRASALALLRFERRSLDGGFEPFNC